MAYFGAVYRWDVFWADLEPSVGHEQKGQSRPVIVLSNDAYNARFAMVTIVPVTKGEEKHRKVYPFEVLLPVGTIAAHHSSIVMPHQIRSISTMRLLEKIGSLRDAPQCEDIENRILEHLDIGFAPDDFG